MRRLPIGNWILSTLVLSAGAIPACGQSSTSAPTTQAFAHGLIARPDYFPIAVWLQDPKNASRYKAIGINLYVGLWKGPTAEQLLVLEKAEMPVICAPTEYGLKNQDRRIIVGWMHEDEPDNAQSLGPEKGYGPPITPERIPADYRRIHLLDPSRPVLLNLGQAVAWNDWYGRGVRTRHPEDYAQYAQGADILSFDIYPVTHDRKEVSGNLWLVGQGVERLRDWSQDRQPVWACIETTHISNPQVRPTPEQIRSLVWMALVHGARGLVYFAHEFKPRFIEAGLLTYPEISQAVGKINRQVAGLAPVLNSPTLSGLATASSSNPAVPIHVLNKDYGGTVYVFAIAMRDGETTGRFRAPGLGPQATVKVLDENRSIAARDGEWEDSFQAYGVHLYQVDQRSGSPSTRNAP